jgi:hypothetical protein
MPGNYSLPRLDVPDSEKNTQKYHEDFARAIVNRSISDSWRNDYMLVAECYKFLEEGSSGELVSHLQKGDDGTDLPAIWLSLNTIPTKIDLLTGELETRGYDIRVRALNKEAVSRKQEQVEKLRVKRKLGPLFKEADEIAGIASGESEYVPQSEAELREYADLSIKDKFEIIMTGILKWVAKRNDWDEERKTLFRDILIANRAWIRNEIIRGIPRSRRVHPLNMIFDTSAKKDDLSDATFFGEVEYLPLASAAERYNLSTEELERVYGKYQEYMGTNAATEAISPSADYAASFETIGGKRLSWFKTVDDELRVLVTRAVWRDYKYLHHKHEKNKKYGSEHLQEIPSTSDVRSREQNKTQLITKKLEIWRQCTIIGGHVVREWGECPNQARDVNDLGTTEAPYKAWIPNYSSGRGVSKVEQLASVQLYKDVLLYNMQLAVLRAGAKGISYDLAMKPDTMTVEQVMKYLKTAGVTFYNSKDFQFLAGSNTSPFREYDLSMSDSVVKYVDLMNYLDREMDKISGISPERQGAVQGASQGLGVQQTALFQSNLITQPYFIGFERFCSRVLNHQAKLAKISWAEGNDVFAPVIGDVGVDFLREHVDLDFEDFAAFSESIPPLIRDREKFESLVMIAVQSDPTFIDEAIQILMEQDTRVAVRRFQRRRAMQKVYMAQEQQASEERQAALEERLKGLEMQGRQMEIDGRLEETQMKNEAGQLKTSSTGRTKLSDTSIKTHVDLLKHQQTLRSQEKQQKEQNEIKRQEIIARNREKSKQQRKTNAKK